MGCHLLSYSVGQNFVAPSRIGACPISYPLPITMIVQALKLKCYRYSVMFFRQPKYGAFELCVSWPEGVAHWKAEGPQPGDLVASRAYEVIEKRNNPTFSQAYDGSAKYRN